MCQTLESYIEWSVCSLSVGHMSDSWQQFLLRALRLAKRSLTQNKEGWSDNVYDKKTWNIK